jgi:hypothetical protein
MSFSRFLCRGDPFGRRALSRRGFLRAGAAAVGALGAGLLWPARARADEVVAPRPIPGGEPAFNPFTDELLHIFPAGPPDQGLDPSSITDFDGFIAEAVVDGMGTARDPGTNATHRLLHEIDVRVMQGTYKGVDHKRHEATFAVI